MIDPHAIVDKFVAEQHKRPPSVIEQDSDLAQALSYALDKIQSGDMYVSLCHLYKHKLQEVFNGPSYDTVKNFIRRNLKRDFKTGSEL